MAIKYSSNLPTLQLSNLPTLQSSNIPTLQHSFLPPMPSILIIGQNSFIGNSFMRYSEHRNVRVSSSFINAADIDFSGIDIVFHVAAIVHVSGKVSPDQYYRVNRDYSLEVAKYSKAAGVRHFIFMSTIKVYGEFDDEMKPWNELSECRPTDYYGKSKYEAESELKKLIDENFCVSIIRIPAVYGYGMKANLLNLLKLVKVFPVLPLEGINNKRYYIYIENLTAFIDRIIDFRIPGTYIAMDDDPVSTTELIKLLAEALHKNIKLFWLPDGILTLVKFLFPDQIKRLYGSFELDNKATLRRLNFKPLFSTKEGIYKMIQEYTRNRK